MAKKNAGTTKAPEQTVPVSRRMLSAVREAVSAALRYEETTGRKRKLGITGEVGEVLVCHKLGLRLCLDSLKEGFDARDSRGKRVQIKTRRSDTRELPRAFFFQI